MADNQVEGSYATRKEAEEIAHLEDEYLIRSAGRPSDRFAELMTYFIPAACINGGDTRRNTVPFMRAFYEELEVLAKTVDEKRQLQVASEMIERQ